MVELAAYVQLSGLFQLFSNTNSLTVILRCPVVSLRLDWLFSFFFGHLSLAILPVFPVFLVLLIQTIRSLWVLVAPQLALQDTAGMLQMQQCDSKSAFTHVLQCVICRRASAAQPLLALTQASMMTRPHLGLQKLASIHLTSAFFTLDLAWETAIPPPNCVGFLKNGANYFTIPCSLQCLV